MAASSWYDKLPNREEGAILSFDYSIYIMKNLPSSIVFTLHENYTPRDDFHGRHGDIKPYKVSNRVLRSYMAPKQLSINVSFARDPPTLTIEFTFEFKRSGVVALVFVRSVVLS